jgi:predicted permease
MFGRARPESDFSEELRAHLALEMDRLRAEGLSEEDAYWQARRNLGNLAGAGERFYESSRWLWLEHLIQDARYALRSLRKAPVFVVTAVVTLALGIGATTSIFTLVHAVLLKSLAVSNPDQLYRLGKEPHCCEWGGYNQNKEFSIVSYDLYKYFRDHTKGFAELAAFQAGETGLGVRREHNAAPTQTQLGEFVSGNYFTMFGVNAYIGRVLTPDDDQPSAPAAAVMSYRLWSEKYGFDRSVVGAVFNLDNKPFTIVGIAPPRFFGDTLRDSPPDFFLPLATEPLLQGDSSLLHMPAAHWLDLIGRIRPNVTPEAVEAQMRLELQQWLRSHWGDMDANSRTNLPQQTLYLSPGGAGITSMRQEYEHWLQILMIVSGLVLLIVCANMANLMLVRGIERRQQTSLSMALGARPTRLVRQALTESIGLSIVGGAAGVAVAFLGTRVILHSIFQTTPGLASVPIDPSPSAPILLFAFGIALVTGISFGIAPALMATRVDPIEALRGSNRSTSRAASLPRKMLVVFQAALSLVVLCASGLLTTTLRNLEKQNFGFEQDRRLVVTIDPVLAGYRADQVDPLYRRIHDSLANVPGVSAVALCLYSPQSGDSWNDGILVYGKPAPGPKDDSSSSWVRVTPGFFEAIGNPIIAGRPLTDQDTNSSRHVAVINQAFAKKFFKNENPVGKHFGRHDPVGRDDPGAAHEYEVIGIAKDARYLTYNLDQPIGPIFFVPEVQYTVFHKPEDTIADLRTHFLHNIVIVKKPGAVLTDLQIRRAIMAADPTLPVAQIQSMRDQVAANFNQQRLIARLTSLFGLLSLVLACIGLYGLTAYNAGRRTTEIGVRMALGAGRTDVIAFVLRGAFSLIVIGLLVGIPLTLAAARFLGNQLYGMNPYDPIVTLTAVLALGLSALVASFIPALRASLISPIQALRTE